MTLVSTTWMKPQRCKKWEYSVGGLVFEPGEIQKKKNGYGVTFFCPPDDSARSPSSFPPECRSGRRRKQQARWRTGEGAHQRPQRALSSPLLSSGVVVAAVLQFLLFVNCATPNPVRCLRFASRFHGGPLCVQKKTRCHLLQNWLIFCAFCVHLLLLLLLVVGGVLILLLQLLLGFFAVFLCAHTHSFIVVILLVWFRLFAVSFRIDKVFRPCSRCRSQGLMTARGSRGRRGWLLVGISGLRFC